MCFRITEVHYKSQYKSKEDFVDAVVAKISGKMRRRYEKEGETRQRTERVRPRGKGKDKEVR